MSDDEIQGEIVRENAENSVDALILSQDDLRIRLGQMRCERDMHARECSILRAECAQLCIALEQIDALAVRHERGAIGKAQEIVRSMLAHKFSLWRPIETAPTDGTPILGYSTEGVSYVCWKRNLNWVFFKDHKGNEFCFEPTDWMPHPPLPVRTAP